VRDLRWRIVEQKKVRNITLEARINFFIGSNKKNINYVYSKYMFDFSLRNLQTILELKILNSYFSHNIHKNVCLFIQTLN